MSVTPGFIARAFADQRALLLANGESSVPDLPANWPPDGVPVAVLDRGGKFKAWAVVDWTTHPYVSPLSRKGPRVGWQLAELVPAATSMEHGCVRYANGDPLDLRASNVAPREPDAGGSDVVQSGACEDHCFQAHIGPGPRVSLVDLSDSRVVFWFLLAQRPSAAVPAAGGACVYVLLSDTSVLEARPDGHGTVMRTCAGAEAVRAGGSGCELDPWAFDVQVDPPAETPLALPRYGGGFEFRWRSRLVEGPVPGAMSPFSSLNASETAPAPCPDADPTPPRPAPHYALGPWWMTYRLPRASRAPRKTGAIPADLDADLLEDDAPVRPVRAYRSQKPRNHRTRAGPVIVSHEIPEPKPARRPKRSAPIRDGFRGKLVGSGLNARWSAGSAGSVAVQ